MHLKKPYLKTKKSNYEEKDNNLMEREGFENNEEKEIFNIDDVVKTELNLYLESKVIKIRREERADSLLHRCGVINIHLEAFLDYGS